ncbi:hypothetical protein N0V90_004937 [Kalmusia sp. IMI 367209]|nr:hypothetical protein N0V90_004937 [Kalmusia sp. IMI 367209]
MLFKFISLFLFVVTASAAPSVLISDSNVNCNFTVHINEVCTFSNKVYLTTEARLDNITSPWGNAVVSYQQGLHVEREPLEIYASLPQELIAGTLSIERPNNEKVEFAWEYGLSGGRPVTEKWTEDDDGTDGRCSGITDHG